MWILKQQKIVKFTRLGFALGEPSPPCHLRILCGRRANTDNVCAEASVTSFRSSFANTAPFPEDNMMTSCVECIRVPKKVKQELYVLQHHDRV